MSAPNATLTVLRGELRGNLIGQLTIALQREAAFGGLVAPHFALATNRGTIAGALRLGRLSIGRNFNAHYRLTAIRGAGIFAHDSSDTLRFACQASGPPATGKASLSVVVNGTLYY